MADRYFHQPAKRPSLNFRRAAFGALSFVFLIAANALAATAAERVLPDYRSLDELPRPVLEAFKPMAGECEWHVSQLMVREFGSDILWSIRCASNHANQIHAYVIAKDEKGAGATLLKFPRPKLKGNSGPLDSLSNAEYDGRKREITHSSSNPEGPPCREQATWRLDGVKPALIYWREARACKGNNWIVKVDHRNDHRKVR